MNQILFPLIIVNVLEAHGSEEKPLTISEIAELINRQYIPFTDRKQVINRSTVARTLESLVLYTEVGDLLNFRVLERGTERKKRYFLTAR